MAISSPLQSKVPTGSARTIKKLQGILFNRTKVKKEIFQRQTILQNRREENERRKQREDELEAPNLVIKPKGPSQLIVGSSQGFFERLIGFLGYLTAGWIVNNLPTWIAMGKEFIARTQQMGKILGGFITNSTDIFKDFTRLLGATLSNLMTFDFLDTSGRVSTAFDELKLSVDNWGTGFEDAIKLLTTPLTEGIASGENARPTGTENTNEGAYETTAPYSGSGRAVSGDSVDKKVLDFIADGEASQSDPYGGFNTSRGKTQGRATDKTIGWLAQNAQGAIGRYQHMPEYILDRAIAAGFDANTKFTPEVQDKITLHFLKTSHSYDQWKSGKLSDEDFLGKLAPTWRAIPQGPKNAARLGGSPNSTYNDRYAGGNASKGTWEQRLSKLKSVKSGATQQPTPTPQPKPAQQSTPGTGQSVIPFANAKFKGGPGTFGAPRRRSWGMDSHAGIDISEASWKNNSDPRVPVVAIRGGVVSSREYKGGHTYMSGCMIEQDDGYTLRYLHMEPFVKPGQKVVAGQKIGRLYNNGDNTHLHLELYQGSAKTGKLINPTSYVQTVLKGGTPTPIASSTQSKPTPAQITPTGTPQNPQMSQSLAQERTGPTVIVSQNPSSPAQQMMYSGGGGSSGGGSSQISEFALLNNFMRNKLLLDLAYL